MNKPAPNNLESFWLPFTPNRDFKVHPRLLARASGMYYWDPQGRKILDGFSGLWCTNAGHCPPKVVEAIREQAGTLDFAPTFQFGHPKVFELANRLAALAPEGLDRVFFGNSGSEAAESALKIARAYFQVTGETKRFRLIGRGRAYHGVNYGGMSVGGLPSNQRHFGPLLPGTEDHLPLPYDPKKDAYTRGEPKGGKEYAEALEKICAQRGGDTIAAVIVEPMIGSGGVYAAPKEYLPALRAICDRHGILLIFDEVITGFGRLGAPFAAQRYGVTPDMICFAKGVTNGAVPLSGVIMKAMIPAAFSEAEKHSIGLFHGYTYTGHPLGAAAGLAALDLYRDEDLFERAKKLEMVLEGAVHGLKGAPHVIDIRNAGCAAAVDLAPIDGHPGQRGYEAMTRIFHEESVVVRLSGDSLVLSPALIASEAEIARIIEAMRVVLGRVG